jgi:hypothetical protein
MAGGVVGLRVPLLVALLSYSDQGYGHVYNVDILKSTLCRCNLQHIVTRRIPGIVPEDVMGMHQL